MVVLRRANACNSITIRGAVDAISGGNRWFLEFSVDLVLLHTDPTNGRGWKIYDSVFSEGLKAAEQPVDFTAPGKVPAVHSEAELFIRREKNSIDDTAAIVEWISQFILGIPCGKYSESNGAHWMASRVH